MVRLSLVLLAAAAVIASGCSTHTDRLRAVRSYYYAGDLASAEALLDKELEKAGGEEDVLLLEKSIVLLADGRPAEAERLLRTVRDRFDYYSQTSAAESALVMLTDDDGRSYAGEDYEQLLIRAMLAMANLMQQGDDAEAYSLQIAAKQQEIIAAAAEEDGTNPKAAYQQVALGPYIRALLREQTHRDYDDAARNWALVASWQPDFPTEQHIQRATTGHHSQPGHGVLCVFALVGRGPYKEEVAEVPSSAALLIADRILSNNMRHELPPTIAPIKVPRVVAPINNVAAVAVTTSCHETAVTKTITDVSAMAVQQYQAIQSHVVARAVVRRAVKKGMIYGAKEALGVQRGSLESIPLELLGVAWEATENADTRCWGLLPDKIQVLRLELPVGRQQVVLQPVDRQHRPLGPAITTTVEIIDGRNTYLLANAPDGPFVGKITVNGSGDWGIGIGDEGPKELQRHEGR